MDCMILEKIEELTMTHIEISEVVGSRPDNVKRTMESLKNKGVISLTQGEEGYVKSDGKSDKRIVYRVNKRNSIIVVAQMCPEFTARLVDRWQELEDSKLVSLQPPQDYASALRALADEVEAKELAIAERDHAIRTKAEIGTRREATAMATASVAVRRADSLANELGKGKTYKQVKAIPWLLDIFAPSRGMYVAVGKALTTISESEDLPMERIQCSEYPEGIKAYHSRAIDVFHNRLLNDSDMLGKYRRLI